MNYWIFVVTAQKSDGENLQAQEIFTQRIADRFWGIGEKMPNRRSLAAGDEVVFYLGSPQKVFAGTATLGSACFELDDGQQREYGHGRKVYTAAYGVSLTETDIWGQQKDAGEVAARLDFIENKDYWFSYFQGGSDRCQRTTT